MYAWVLFLAMVITAMSPGITAKAEEAAAESHGLMGEWYRAVDGEGINRFVFQEDHYLGDVPVENFNDIQFRSTISGLLGHNDDVQYVLARFTGKIEIPEDGDYTFYMIGDDGFRLYIDNELVIDFWKQEWEKEQTSDPVSLTAGKHNIRVEYLQGHGGAWLGLRWSSDSIEKSVVPADAFYLTKESSFHSAKRLLAVEREKAQSALASVQGAEDKKRLCRQHWQKQPD